MKFFRAFRRKRCLAAVDKVNDRMERIGIRLDHMDRDSQDAEYLREERVRLFWKRNALYLKLDPTKE